MRCLVDDATYQIEAVLAGRQGEPRLVAILLWQLRHAAGIDIRRIADDQVVALFADGREEIAAV